MSDEVTQQEQGTAEGEQETPAAEGTEDTGGDDQADTFPRDYVEKLRKENGDYRTKAKRADELAQRLHTELVRATGKLADPSDLPFDAGHLDSPEALTAAVDGLLAGKPHLAARRPQGDIGQGAAAGGAGGVDLAGLLRGGAG